MKIHRDIDQLPVFKNAVITIGTFDGVHEGHRQILNQLKEEAQKIKGETVIVTFNPHPRKVLRSDKPGIQLINTIEEKIELLSQQGIDHLVIVPFTEDFSKLTAKQYVEDFLVKKFHPHTVIIGYDHHFGQGREGNYRLLEQYEKDGAFKLKEIPEHILNASGVSSTRIRAAILNGKIEEANELLGYTFFFEGLVVEGDKLGRKLGYPTANLRIEEEEKLVPGNGVYAVTVGSRESGVGSGFPIKSGMTGVGSQELKGMMNIGVRPTLGGTKRVIEVNLFDFDKDIYGKRLRVYVKKRLRDEKKFNGLEELKQQLAKDKENTIKELG
jgi:riboflavin kinase / FMN adenylyltransferase